MFSFASPRYHRAWVVTCLFLVFYMVIIGGLTRLTESGLSIVEWKLVSGILPPLTQEGWEAEFAAYRATPEYHKENSGMNLSDFQGIFWLEYLHRLLGRAIGLAVLLPLGLLWARRTGEPWFRRRMTLIAVLIGLQGTVGWYMVKSGLIDVPWVSPYRLALHLSLAVTIFGCLLVTWLRLSPRHPAGAQRSAGALPVSPGDSGPSLRESRYDGLYGFAFFTLAALFLQIVLGAFVAGLDAGFTYNTFPLMDGDVIPAEMRALEPSLRHYLENIAAVQFLHRWWAFAVTALVLAASWRAFRQSASAEIRRVAMAMAALVVAQVMLGILTLLWVVPTGLATLHQGVAVLLFGAVLWLTYRTRQAKMPQISPGLTSVNASLATVH